MSDLEKVGKFFSKEMPETKKAKRIVGVSYIQKVIQASTKGKQY